MGLLQACTWIAVSSHYKKDQVKTVLKFDWQIGLFELGRLK